MQDSTIETRYATQEDLMASAPSSLWKDAWTRF